MGERLSPGDDYDGMLGGLKDSPWLTHMDLPPDRDAIVQIERVVRRAEVKFKNEAKKNYGSLRFVGKEKELGLCATNINTLAALFGPSAKALPGKWIALYVDHHVQAFGKTVSAIRIRDKKVDPPKGKDNAAREPGGEG